MATPRPNDLEGASRSDRIALEPKAGSAARRRVLIAGAGGFLGLYLELSAVPYIAAHHGGRFAAGLLTFALMATTVPVQALIPLLLRRFSAGALLAAGLVLIGAPTLFYEVSQSVPNLIAVTLVRGAGFGLITVVGSALTAAYSTPGSRGSALGSYGVAISIGAAFAPALGVAISRSSPLAVYVLGTVPPLLGAAALIGGLPPATIHAPKESGPSSGQSPGLAAVVLVFGVIAAAIAAEFTFVPLLSVGSTPVLLFLFGAGFAAGRTLGGHLLDRGRVPTVLVLKLLIVVVIGLALLGISSFAAAATGAAASGVCIGSLCTVTLVMMLDRSGPGGVARGSVIWNITFDVGQALGAVALGGVASGLGTGGVFLVAAGLVALVAGPAAAFDWRLARSGVPATV